MPARLRRRLLGAGVVGLCVWLSGAALAQDARDGRSHADSLPALEDGIRLFRDGRFSSARRLFEAVRHLHPHNTGAAFYLGRIAFAEQEYTAAIDWFETAAGGESCSAEFHMWLGRAYGHHARQVSRLRQPFVARNVHAHFEKAVACDPDHVAARWDLMEYYLKAPALLGGSRTKAVQQAERIARLDPAEGRKARRLIAEIDR